MKNYLTCCLVVVFVGKDERSVFARLLRVHCLIRVASSPAALSCSGRESSGSGSGSGVDYCSAPATEYLGCADRDRVERFHFSVEENRCKSYSTCPPEDPQTESNFFVSLQDCETACPRKNILSVSLCAQSGFYIQLYAITFFPLQRKSFVKLPAIQPTECIAVSPLLKMVSWCRG